MTFPFDNEDEKKRLENKLLIKAIKLLLPVARQDRKKAEEDGNIEYHNELLDVMGWLLDKHDQLLIENGECIE